MELSLKNNSSNGIVTYIKELNTFEIYQRIYNRIRIFMNEDPIELVSDFELNDEFIKFANFLLVDYDYSTIKMFYHFISKFHDKVNRIIRLIDQNKKTSFKINLDKDLEDITNMWTQIIDYAIRFKDSDQGVDFFNHSEKEIINTITNLNDLINMDQRSISKLSLKWKLRSILLEEKYIRLASLRKPKVVKKRYFFGKSYNKKVNRLLLPDITNEDLIIVKSFKPLILGGFKEVLMLTS